MTFNENIVDHFSENTFPNTCEISFIEFNNDETFSSYSQNYVDILGDLVETIPVQVAEIIRPYENNLELSMKIRSTYRQLRRVSRLKNRKQSLVMFFLLGQLIDENNLSIQQVLAYGVTKYYRRVALRLFHLYENIGVQQLLRSNKMNIRKLLNLKQEEYEQLVEFTKFAGAQI